MATVRVRTVNDFLFKVESPWLYLGEGESDRRKWNPESFYSREGMRVCVRQLRGNKMRTVSDLMSEFGAALQFFEGFGENWHALAECLNYLDEWLPADAYVLVVERATEVLADEQPDQLEALLLTLHEAGEWWAKPVEGNSRFDRGPVPFHVLLNTPSSLLSDIDRIKRAARRVNVPMRV